MNGRAPRNAARCGLVLAASIFTLATGSTSASAAVTCDRVAAPNGNDANPGTVDQPFKTAQKLVDSVGSGQTACLRAGSYGSDDEVKLAVSGVTLTSYPGERATIQARLWIQDSANGVTISDLDLDGRNDRGLPSPTINGDEAVLRGNDITNHHTGICLSLGQVSDWGRAVGTLVEANRIHDCGRLPATNYDHGIYINAADHTVIRDNFIYDNADRGIQIYPDAHDTLVTGNVIDGNGEGVIFGGSEETASSNNTVENNVITNSKLRSNIESFWSGPVGSGNIARNNCVGGGANDDGNGGILTGTIAQLGFNSTNNLVEVPQFADPENGDFTIPPSSPCAALLAGASQAEVVAPTAVPPAVTIDTNRKKIRRMVPVSVRGKAHGAGTVTLLARRDGRWKQLGSAGTRANGSYKLEIRLHRSGRETVKAVAAGLRDSKPVKLRVKK